ncbi:MAG: hypothetical protein PHV20_12475 [Bacteroidales bacterium]|nr:hypothetical protein [Bacteroidales bacterium]
MIEGFNTISLIAIIIVAAQKNKHFESSFSIEKGSIFISIKRGDEQLYNFVEPISYFENQRSASAVSSRIIEILEERNLCQE